MISRKLIVSLIIICCILSFTIGAYAVYDDDYTEWTTNAASYGPDDGIFEGGSVDVTSGNTDYCICKAFVWYTSSNITSITDYYNDDDFVTGLDITDINDDLNANGWYGTTYPNPYFDMDNDFPWVHGEEETKIVTESPLDLDANTQYTFQVRFNEDGGGDASFELNTHMSEWDSLFGEYQTQWHNLLGTISFDMPPLND